MNADARKYRFPPELVMPGDIADKAFAPPEPGKTHVFFANTSDKHLVASIVSFIPGIKIASTAHLSPESEKHEWQSLLGESEKCVALITPESMADVIIQQQIHAALDSSKDVVLIHDLRQANEFGDILNACPKSLQDKGLFDHLAVALYGGDYQHISLQLLWQRLSLDESKGEKRKNSNFLSRNSVVMPMPTPAFPQKSFLGESFKQKIEKEDEARTEEPTMAKDEDKKDNEVNADSKPRPAGREERLGSIDRLIDETNMAQQPSSDTNALQGSGLNDGVVVDTQPAVSPQSGAPTPVLSAA